MQVFNAVIRLAGSKDHEVVKRGLTVPEILVMRKIHGAEGVVNLEHVGSIIDFDHDDERERLSLLYNDGLSALSDGGGSSINAMFGEYGELVAKLKGYTGQLSIVESVDPDDFTKTECFISEEVMSPEEERRKKQAEKIASKKAAISDKKKASDKDAMNSLLG